jgi:uncharacterized protein DUF4389
VNGRPVRLVVDDDRRRSRLTVFFRLFLAIPHFFWLGLWAFAVFFTAFAQWVVTVIRGRPASPLNSFHAAFIRYATHVGAYLSLAANPFPGFLGDTAYPLDVELEPSERQGRLGAFFRLLIAVPAWFLLWTINFGGVGVTGPYFGVGLYFHSLGVVAGFLAWFACLALGRMPLGLRNLIAYALRYTAEVYAYSLLLTSTYPSSDPTLPAEAEPPPAHPIGLVVDDDRRRSRLTTFFRLFLAVPHIVWLLLWGVLALLAIVAQWFIALVRGRPAAPLHQFLAAYVSYQTHVAAFLYLVANPFPGFTGQAGYPIELHVAPPERQSRWVTLFRFFLALPAFMLVNALGLLLFMVGLGGWFAALAIGRMPEGLRNAGAYALRYNAQVVGYMALLTARYPFSGPPALEPVVAPWAVTEPAPVDAPA